MRARWRIAAPVLVMAAAAGGWHLIGAPFVGASHPGGEPSGVGRLAPPHSSIVSALSVGPDTARHRARVAIPKDGYPDQQVRFDTVSKDDRAKALTAEQILQKQTWGSPQSWSGPPETRLVLYSNDAYGPVDGSKPRTYQHVAAWVISRPLTACLEVGGKYVAPGTHVSPPPRTGCTYVVIAGARSGSQIEALEIPAG
jgi:hypothetical protein